MDTRKSKAFAECEVEKIVLVWFESQSLGWRVKHGPEIALGTLEAEREDFGQVVLPQPLRGAPLPKLLGVETHTEKRRSLLRRAHE